MSLRNPSCPFCGMPPLDGEPCCKRGQSSKPAPAAPVTDADIEAAIDAVDLAAYDHATSACFGAASNTAQCARERFAAIDALKTIIARRVQQAGTAAEDLARAVEAALPLFGSRGKQSNLDCVAHSLGSLCGCKACDCHVRMSEALAAFRKAQGGGA